MDVPKSEKRTKSKTEGRGDRRRKVLSAGFFFQWIMCVKGGGGDALRGILR